MAARKYRGFANKSGDGVVCPRFTIRTDDVPVTAYDSRDVDPLLRAARRVTDTLLGVSPEADGFCTVPTRQLRKLAAELAPFEESEEGSK